MVTPEAAWSAPPQNNTENTSLVCARGTVSLYLTPQRSSSRLGTNKKRLVSRSFQHFPTLPRSGSTERGSDRSRLGQYQDLLDVIAPLLDQLHPSLEIGQRQLMRDQAENVHLPRLQERHRLVRVAQRCEGR